MSNNKISPKVTALKLKRKSRVLEVQFDNGEQHSLTFEMLRVCSPSAEVQGHGNPQLVTHKKMVNIDKVEPVGSYAVKLHFDDGHHSGIFSWHWLYHLASNKEALWKDYLERLTEAKGSREELIPIDVKFFDPNQG